MAGRLRDPLVRRDLLFGVILGLIWALIFESLFLVMQRMGAFPVSESADLLLGARRALGAWLMQVLGSVRGTLIFFFVMFLLRVLLRKQWLATVAFVVIWAAMRSLGRDFFVIQAPAVVIVYGIAAIAVVRFGLVTLAVGIFTADALLNVPFTLDLSSWYAGSTAFVLMSVLALAAWGFYTSLGRQQLWKAELFE